ncbi:hypothetical protein SELMODRAFT_120707 [Selaginella moellendorffii]|uniref:Erythromycin esterase n=1 Tax=Selaginella moellendorffii TaxID=88036 RepID=D8SMK5_SELML|nr:hypothetical protein SELMODRAFT_120707 [Selaginella moellendorffii]
MGSSPAVSNAVFKEISRRAVPISLHNPARDLAPLIERIAKAKVVMLGEATHGTREFYEWRRIISEILIANHGFTVLNIEGDWPPCQEVNRFITKKVSSSASAEELLAKSFRRWPTWMWANDEFRAMVEWMKEFNSTRLDRESQVRLFGLDVYSLFDSIAIVLDEVAKIDPALAEKAKHHYACFDPFEANEEEYLQSLVEFPEGCQAEALRVLKDLLKKRINEETAAADGDVVFDAQQNARIVRNNESYYRAMVYGNEDSWNVCESHMMETLDLLLKTRPHNKLIVWAHNTHIGDYCATNMRKMGQVNIGGLVREKYGESQVALVGFGTFKGSVIASSKWAGPILQLHVPEGRDGSYEMIICEAAQQEKIPGDAFYLLLDDSEARKVQHCLSEWRGQRAIGVVYDPKKEKWGNYVPTMLAKRYDAFIYIHETKALRPLGVTPDLHVLPETYPSGQ